MDYLLLKEKEIILNAANNEQAFLELYEYYFPRVYNYVFARVGEKGASEDITSGVFEKIIAKISTYKPECGKFSTWLFTITHNMVMDYFRKSKKDAFILVDQLEEESSDQPSIEELMILEEDKKNLLMCLSLLSDRDRNIVSLKFWSQLSNQEIAEIVNESSNHIAVILYRSIKRLKTLILDQEAEEVRNAR
ncbi:MAG: sigma-70 family RNA polymerase sigma factor [Peptostreptococcaceae bacterium]|nr:sigma-70 family RNA polymerase sigma factor [Peptostreptococcaceae bacterium]